MDTFILWKVATDSLHEGISVVDARLSFFRGNEDWIIRSMFAFNWRLCPLCRWDWRVSRGIHAASLSLAGSPIAFFSSSFIHGERGMCYGRSFLKMVKLSAMEAFYGSDGPASCALHVRWKEPARKPIGKDQEREDSVQNAGVVSFQLRHFVSWWEEERRGWCSITNANWLCCGVNAWWPRHASRCALPSFVVARLSRKSSKIFRSLKELRLKPQDHLRDLTFTTKVLWQLLRRTDTTLL